MSEDARKLPPDLPLRAVWVFSKDRPMTAYWCHAAVINPTTRALELFHTVGGRSFAVEVFAEGTYLGFRQDPYTREEVAEIFAIREQQEEVEFENQMRAERLAFARQQRLLESHIEHKLKMEAIAGHGTDNVPSDEPPDALPARGKKPFDPNVN